MQKVIKIFRIIMAISLILFAISLIPLAIVFHFVYFPIGGPGVLIVMIFIFYISYKSLKKDFQKK